MPKVKVEKTLADVVASGRVSFTAPVPGRKRAMKPRTDSVSSHRAVLALPLSAGLAPYKARKHTPAGPGLEPQDVGSWEDEPSAERPPVGICYQCKTVREGRAVGVRDCAVCGSRLVRQDPAAQPSHCCGDCATLDAYAFHYPSCQARLNPPFRATA